MGSSIFVVVIVHLSGQLASCIKRRAVSPQVDGKDAPWKSPKNGLSQCACKKRTTLCDPTLVPLSSASLNRLRKDQSWLQSALDIGSTKYLRLQSFFHGSAEGLGAVALQNFVQPIHIVEPLPGPAMDNLGEIEKSNFSQVQ